MTFRQHVAPREIQRSVWRIECSFEQAAAAQLDSHGILQVAA